MPRGPVARFSIQIEPMSKKKYRNAAPPRENKSAVIVWDSGGPFKLAVKPNADPSAGPHEN